MCMSSCNLHFHLVESLELFVRDHPTVTTLAVDMPMALAARPARGGRPCDREARRYLGKPAGASIFSAPTLDTLTGFHQNRSYRSLHEAQQATFAGAPGLSKQTFFLLPKIGEADAFWRGHSELTVLEGHPEVAWKKRGLWRIQSFLSKKTRAGRAAREDWIRGHFAQTLVYPEPPRVGPRACIDDWLDAAVLADVAATHLTDARRFFGNPSSPAEADAGRIYY